MPLLSIDSLSRVPAWPTLCLMLVVSGCTSPPPEFEPNDMAACEAELVDPHRQQIARVLQDLFGTPDEPRVPPQVELDIEKLRVAAGPAGYEGDDEGQKRLQRGLYRQHCATCHGITGNGSGPAAGMLEPYPRDFRPGVFKWKSTYHAAKPTDDDLRRILAEGIPDTAMPSFALLDETQIDALVEYVKYLAIRGQVEWELTSLVGDEFDFDPRRGTTDDPLDPADDSADQDLIDEVASDVAGSWQDLDRMVVRPAEAETPTRERISSDLAASIAAGRELFGSDRVACWQCHGRSGDGVPSRVAASQGVVIKELDDWNTAVYDFRRDTRALAESVARRQEQLASLPVAQAQQAAELLAADERRLRQRQQVAAQLLDPQPARPRSLRRGVFRGGGDPVDLFRRIHQGIAGTPMPGQGPPRPGIPGALTEEEMWHLVDYVRSLSEGSQL